MREQDHFRRRLSARFSPERPHPGPSGTNRDGRRRRLSPPSSIVTTDTTDPDLAGSTTSRHSVSVTPGRRLSPGDDRDRLSDADSSRDPCSDSDSLAVNMPSSLPSLSSDTASASSSTSSLSLDTLWASGLGVPILEDDGTGALVVPSRHGAHHHHHHHLQHAHPIPPPAPTPPTPHRHHSYICLFYILDCHDTFDDADQWKTHVLSHFRTHAPPPTARCPLCPGERFDDAPLHSSSSSSTISSASVPSAPSPPASTSYLSSYDDDDDNDSHHDDHEPTTNTAWDQLLAHVDTAHYQQGQTLAGSRPDFELMQYLFRLRIISVEQFKAMQLLPPPSSPAYHTSQESVRRNIGSSDEPYCAPYSRRREARMRGQRRGVSVI